MRQQDRQIGQIDAPAAIDITRLAETHIGMTFAEV
jgi:hypothetical protein